MARTATPKLSMSLKAKFKTQESFWDVEITGPLTDKAITAYALAGKYGPETQKLYQANAEAAKPSSKKRHRDYLKNLLARL